MMKTIITLILLSTFTPALGQTANNSEDPTRTVERIFNDYIKYSESTDSKDNKNAMTTALTLLQASAKNSDFYLLVNVWMYYDPTDFPTRTLIEPIFLKNKDAAVRAIERRIRNKKKTETTDSAPLSDLLWLKERLLASTAMLIPLFTSPG